VNCVCWALAYVAGIPADEMSELLRPFVDRGWVELDEAGQISEVRMLPQVAAALMPVWSFEKIGPIWPADWARWSVRWYPDTTLMLIVDSVSGSGFHVLLARNGLLLDNQNPEGLPGSDHPYADKRVRCILRFDDGADTRRWAPVVDPAAQTASAGRTGAIL
jgi:hypothetical protein